MMLPDSTWRVGDWRARVYPASEERPPWSAYALVDGTWQRLSRTQFSVLGAVATAALHHNVFKERVCVAPVGVAPSVAYPKAAWR